MRGRELMRRDIEAAIPLEWRTPVQDPPPPQWLGVFTRHVIVLAVSGTAERVVPLPFEVERTRLDLDELQGCTFQRVRVVGFHQRQWHVDPSLTSIGDDLSWRLWAWDSSLFSAFSGIHASGFGGILLPLLPTLALLSSSTQRGWDGGYRDTGLWALRRQPSIGGGRGSPLPSSGTSGSAFGTVFGPER